MYCDPGTTPGGVNYAICSLTGAASPSNSRWTFDGNYLSSYDNQTFVRFACGGTGAHWTVSVTYTDNTGTTVSDSQWGTCGGRPE
jgi:hypothetical protein